MFDYHFLGGTGCQNGAREFRARAAPAQRWTNGECDARAYRFREYRKFDLYTFAKYRLIWFTQTCECIVLL